MSDAIYNTLLAVSMMCSSHVVSGGSIANDWIAIGPFKPGFERCETVVKKYNDERRRREKADEVKKENEDAGRLANAIHAIDGVPFKEEPAPQPQKSQFGNSCVTLTSGPVNGGL